MLCRRHRRKAAVLCVIAAPSTPTPTPILAAAAAPVFGCLFLLSTVT